MGATPTLLHRADAPGGNIGGVGPRKAIFCQKWEKDGFSIFQGATGFPLSFLNLSQSRTTGLSGTAQYLDNNGRRIHGAVSGSIGADFFQITVHWENGAVGTYVGQIGPDGKTSGTTTDQERNPETFSGVAPLKCVEDEACAIYADTAANLAKSFKDLGCGPTEGRWSLDRQQHLDWCMAQPVDAPVIADENAARNE